VARHNTEPHPAREERSLKCLPPHPHNATAGGGRRWAAISPHRVAIDARPHRPMALPGPRARGRTMPGLGARRATLVSAWQRNESPGESVVGHSRLGRLSREPKGAAPPPLGCAEDTQKSLLASAGELRSEQNGPASGRGRGYARREAGLREITIIDCWRARTVAIIRDDGSACARSRNSYSKIDRSRRC